MTDELFSTIPADHAMAVWLSLRVPDDAQPGVYTGKATVSADGVEPVDVPIEVKVSDWRIPDPADFTVFSGVTVNPHALHRRYSHKWVEGRRPTSLGWHDYIRQSDTKAEGWYSAPHLALIRRTYQLLARIGGGDWLDIYVLNNQHEIVWIRQPGGSLQFDFANLERLLDVVVETSGKPKVINFNIMYPGRSDDYVAPVPVREHDGNEIEWVDLGSDADPEIRKEYWRQFAEALYAFMRSKGLEDRMYWGTPWDLEGDHELVELMRSVLPQVYWTRKSHGFMPNETYRAVSVVYRSGWARDNPTIVGFHDGFPVPALESMLGWNNEEHYLLANTREHSSIHFLPGKYPPLGYRVMPERCLVRGYIGYGVVTAEDRGDALPIRGPRHVGIGIRMLYWPGPDGMNTGVHVEALLEGIQEAEARIFIERAIVAGRLPDELKERAIELLNERTAAVDHIRVNAFGRFGQMFELHHGWRERSEALYELAAEVAQFVD